jgi:hypothetical protein
VPTTHIAYETTTGRILLAHHFEGEPTEPEVTRRDAVLLAEHSEKQVAEEQVAVISVDEIEAERPYRVDVDREVLVEAGAGEEGVVVFAVTGGRPEGAGESP